MGLWQVLVTSYGPLPAQDCGQAHITAQTTGRVSKDVPIGYRWFWVGDSFTAIWLVGRLSHVVTAACECLPVILACVEAGAQGAPLPGLPRLGSHPCQGFPSSLGPPVLIAYRWAQT